MNDSLKRLKTTSSRARKAIDERNDLIRQAREEGATWQQLGEAAGLHPNACARIVKGQDAWR